MKNTKDTLYKVVVRGFIHNGYHEGEHRELEVYTNTSKESAQDFYLKLQEYLNGDGVKFPYGDDVTVHLIQSDLNGIVGMLPQDFKYKT